VDFQNGCENTSSKVEELVLMDELGLLDDESEISSPNDFTP
jgi:hypothetical protein